MATPSRARRRRRLLLASPALLLLTILAQPAFLWSRAAWRDRPAAPPTIPGTLDDSSGHNAVPVAETWAAPADMDRAASGLRDLIASARARGLPVSIAGARHSQGGQALCRQGVSIDLSALNHVRIEADRATAWIGAGARWSEVLPALDAAGLSVKVMQSNHDFSVGGTLSVNAHGWQPGSPPVSSTVRELRLVNARGELLTASREQNPEWFRHVLGGYGLFGVILEARLDLVPNAACRPVREVVDADAYPAAYAHRMAENPDAVLAYGRLSVAPGAFLREALLTRYRPAEGPPPPLHPAPAAPFHRAVYRAQIGSDAGKAWRWRLERFSGEHGPAGDAVSRNQLLHEPSAVYREQNADRVDLLHEYFIPAAGFAAFLREARALIPGRAAELMNVTIREVRRDPDTALAYADQDVFGLVMLFNQPRTDAALRDMDELASALVSASIRAGGRPYLCYRPPSDLSLLRKAYPHLGAFLAAKRRMDPEGLFQSEWLRVLTAEGGTPGSTGR